MCEPKGGAGAFVFALLAALTVLFAPATPSLAQNAGDMRSGAVVDVTGTGGPTRIFGASVTFDGAASNLRAAGAVLKLRGAIEGDVWAAGADVLVNADAGGEMRVAGARVVVGGSTAGNVKIAGAVVDVGVATQGSLRAAGASLSFNGSVAGNAVFSGAVVTIDGRIDGAVTVNAERLIIGPQAVIAGNLLVRSLREPAIDPAATISGQMTRQSPDDWFNGASGIATIIVAAAFAASILLSGLVLLLFARNFFGEAVDNVRFRAGRSLAYGIFGPLILFVLAIILMATVIGLPVGIALLLLLFVFALFGQPVAGAGLVGWIFCRGTLRLNVVSLILFLILGAMLLVGLFLIPVVGPLIASIALIIGLGGFLRALPWRLRTTRPLV